MTDDKPRTILSRRKVLKVSGLAATGAAGLSLSGSTAASESTESDQEDSNQSGQKRPFDPENEEEVKEYLKELKESDNPEEEFSSLADEHKKAALSVLELDEVEVTETVTTATAETASPDSISPASYPYEDKRASRRLVGKNSIGDELWEFVHDIYFEYNGAGDVRNIDSDATGETFYPFWFRRNIRGDIDDFGGSFEAFKEGTFEFCATDLGCVQQVNP